MRRGGWVAVTAAVALGGVACNGGAAPAAGDRAADRAAAAELKLRASKLDLQEQRARLADLSAHDRCASSTAPPPPPRPAPGPMPTTQADVDAELAATRAQISAWEARAKACESTRADAAVQAVAKAVDDIVTAVDLRALPTLGATPTTPKVEIHAADVDLDQLLMALGGGPLLRVADDQQITGIVRAATDHDAAVTLASLAPGKVISTLGSGRGGRALTLGFADARTVDLFRLVATVERRNVFVAVDAPATTVSASGVSADGFARSLAALHGLTIEQPARDVWVVRAAAALDPALVKLGDAKVTVDSVGATFGELLAALHALGAVTVGAACGASAPLPWLARQAPVGPTVAAMALRAATTPTADATCALPTLSALTAANRPVALVAAGDRRAAIVETAGGGHALAVDAPAGSGWRLTDAGVEIGGQLVALHADALALGMLAAPPPPSPSSVDDPVAPLELERLFENGRLAATIVRAKDARAVFQRPDGKWQVVPGLNDPPMMWAPKITPGRVTYPTQVPGQPPDERVILLHAT